MRIRSFLILPTLLSSLVLFACGAATNEAKGPEKDPWAGYKGTYATAATAKEAKADVAKSEPAPKAEAAPVAEAELVADEPAPAPAADAKPAKKAKGGAAKAPKAAAAPKKKK